MVLAVVFLVAFLFSAVNGQCKTPYQDCGKIFLQ